MAGRSFKPASYLASAQSPKLKPARPPFARSASNSSAHSDDGFLCSLKALTTSSTSTSNYPPTATDEQNGGGGYWSDGASSRSHTAGHTAQTSLDDTSSRRGSQPISIEPTTTRERQAYTPLSARGDLPGGYFPNHEPIIKSYRANQPFSQSYLQHPAAKSRTTHHSTLSYSSQSSNASPKEEYPMTDTTPRVNQQQTTAAAVMREMNMKHMMPPMGKYHPSNYQLSPATPTSNGSAAGVASVPAQINVNNLYIPSKHNKGKREPTSSHERKPSDVKRQLHQYQRDMIVAARISQATNGGPSPKPESPKLLPLGSPGPITPFLLEEEQGGYILARGPRDTGREIEAAEDKDRQKENHNPEAS